MLLWRWSGPPGYHHHESEVKAEVEPEVESKVKPEVEPEAGSEVEPEVEPEVIKGKLMQISKSPNMFLSIQK